MANFEYSIFNGLAEYRTGSSLLYVVKRSVPKEQACNFATNVYTRSQGSCGGAVISLLYNRDKLGELRMWRDITSNSPNRLANQLSDMVRNHCAGRDEARLLMTKFALYAASDLLNESKHSQSIDTIVQLMPEYKQVVTMNPHFHTASLGVVDAQQRRAV